MRLALIVFSVLAAALAFATTAGAQSSETIGIISMDADITGNTATSLGPLNACTRVEPGESVTLDLVVDAVPASLGVIGYQFNIEYDPALLEVTLADNEFLLAATGSYEPFEGLGDALPDTDGNYLIITVDLASGEVGDNTETGAGVLVRLTFKAKAAGLSTVAPQFDPPDIYPSVISPLNTAISVDSIGAASVAIGQDCPVPIEATPVITELPPIDQIPGLETPVPLPSASPTPEDQTAAPSGSPGSATAQPSGDAGNGPGITDIDEGDGGGTSVGTIVAVAGLAVAGLGLVIGGVALLRRRPSGGNGGIT